MCVCLFLVKFLDIPHIKMALVLFLWIFCSMSYSFWFVKSFLYFVLREKNTIQVKGSMNVQDLVVILKTGWTPCIMFSVFWGHRVKDTIKTKIKINTLFQLENCVHRAISWGRVSVYSPHNWPPTSRQVVTSTSTYEDLMDNWSIDESNNPSILL